MFSKVSSNLNNNISNDNSGNIFDLEFDFEMCHSCYLCLWRK
jgi:hypothetical protein